MKFRCFIVAVFAWPLLGGASFADGGGDGASPSPLDDLDRLNVVFAAKFAGGGKAGVGLVGATIRVEKESEFPRSLDAGRRVAVFLGSPASPGEVSGWSVAIDAETAEPVESDSPTAERLTLVEARFNGRLLARRRVHGRFRRWLFVPASWIEDGMNVLEIRDNGPSRLRFESFSVEWFSVRGWVRPAWFPKETEEGQDDGGKGRGLPRRVVGIAESAARLAESSRRLMEKAALGLTHRLIRHASDGGRWFPAAKFADVKGRRGYCFFDPFTRRPTAPRLAIPSIAPLFAGSAKSWKVLPLSVAPTSEGDFLNSTDAAAALNNADAVTVALAAWPDDRGKSVELVVPTPWSGAVRVTESFGILPPEASGGDSLRASGWLSARRSRTRDERIDGGALTLCLTLGELTVVRIARKGGRPPAPLKLSDKPPLGMRKPVFSPVGVAVSKTRPASSARRVFLLDIRTATAPGTISDFFETGVVPATRGRVGAASGVVPWDSKSLRVEFDASASPRASGVYGAWAELRFARPPLDAERLSFWVRPTLSADKSSDGKSRSVSKRRKRRKALFRFSCLERSSKGRWRERFLSAKIALDEWSRVEVGTRKGKGKFSISNH